MIAIESYVHDVMARIEADLLVHLGERVASGVSSEEAVARMGDPADVARGYLEGVALVYASPSRRLGAFLLDMALGMTLLLSLALLATLILEPGAEEPLTMAELPVAVSFVGAAFVLGLLYFPLLETVFGQTVGKRAFDVTVTREDGRRIGFGAAVIRRLPFLFDFWPVDAAFLYFTKKRQRAFDIVARTVVIDAGPAERAWMWVFLGWVPPALLFLALQLVLG
jgi:uncharacterized RDD family membrane protein YckC